MQDKPKIALLMWGNVIEDFIGKLGISLDGFLTEFVGSWMFGYVDALRLAGVETVLFCLSERVETPLRTRHKPTGAQVCVLPATRAYRFLQRGMRNPYGRNVQDVFGEVHGVGYALFPLLALLRELVLYLPTPPGLLARELRREGCSAVLCQEYEYPRFDVCVAVGSLMRLPVFACFQGGDYQRSRLERLLRPFALRACAGLIIAPRTEIRRVQARYALPSSKVARVFNPVDTYTWRPKDRTEARRSLGIPLDARVAVWHGRVSLWKKGLDLLLDAWHRVCDERPGVELRLLLLGSGQDVEEVRRHIAAMPLRGVMLRDEFVADREVVRRYLSAADVYTFPSRHEGLAVAPLEAMACGLPVVAADASGVPDMLEGGESSGGVVVPRNDSVAFAAALGRLLDDPVLSREMGERARSRVEDCFSLAVVGQQLRAFLLGSPSGQGAPRRRLGAVST